MRFLFVIMLLLAPLAPARAQVSVEFGIPSVSIGFNQTYYPRMVAVPGYPVYYDPGADSNYFFYDGMYWVYERDNWYASSWYNGPWSMVARHSVPLYLLRVPVGYYRHPPAYFRGWHRDSPPRWGQTWGRDWEHQHRGWDRWDRRAMQAPAPLPDYQRQYDGHRYPRAEQQHALRSENYRHEHRDDVVRRTYQAQYQRGEPQLPQRAEPNRQPQYMQPGRGPDHMQPGRGPEHTQPGRGPEHMQPGRGPEHVQQGRGPEQDRMRQDRAVEPKPGQQPERQRGREGPGHMMGEERRPEHDR